MDLLALEAVAELALREGRKQPRKARTQQFTNRVHGIDKKTRTHADAVAEIGAAGHLGDGSGSGSSTPGKTMDGRSAC